MIRTLKWVAFLTYLLFLIYIVFLARRRSIIEWNDAFINVIPFKNLVVDFKNIENVGIYNYLTNLFGNILLFVPLPFFITLLFNIRHSLIILICGFFLSMLIEVVQYFLQIGIPDIDDLILNMLGTIGGLFIIKKKIIENQSL